MDYNKKPMNASSPGSPLYNLVRYCNDYIRLTNPSFSKNNDITPFLETYIGLSSLFAAQQETIPITFNTFYKYAPKDVPEELKEEYEKEKKLLESIQSYWSKYRVNPYTKDLRLQFGFYEIEYPKEILLEPTEDVKAEQPEPAETKLPEKKIENVKSEEALFSIPITIEEINNKYYIKFADTHITPHLNLLSKLLEGHENLYYDLQSKINDLENFGGFELPLQADTLSAIWDEVKAKLKHAEITFGESSFQSLKPRIALQSKANYFLSEDLQKLQDLLKDTDPEEIKSSLGAWITDEGLNEEAKVPAEDSPELYFPFPTNDSQREVLRNITNKVSIVQGPPGTGKSTTISNLVTHLAAHGQTVLFVSQKPQAIKVVKDQLKKLHNDLLYGYIPDPSSYIVTDEDMKDSIANKINGIEQIIDTYTEQDTYRRRTMVVDPQTVSEAKEEMSQSFEEHKRYYELVTKVDSLSEFHVPVTNIAPFQSNFSKTNWTQLQETIALLQVSKETLETHRTNSDLPWETYGSQFKGLQFDEHIHLSIHSVHGIVKEKMVDRSSLLANIQNWMLKQFNLEELLKPVPKEIYDEVVAILTSSGSKHTKLLKLQQLQDYSHKMHLDLLIPILEKKRAAMIREFGLDEEGYEFLFSLIEKHGFETVLKKISLIFELLAEIKALKICDPNAEHAKIDTAKLTEFQRIEYYLINILLRKATTSLNNVQQRGLLKQIAYAYKKSKKAYRTFDKLKQNPDVFPLLMSIIPIWIMSLEDASRLLPLTQGMFDYVIIDEASQCNIAYTLPVMFRTNHVIFFGDSYQMRDSTLSFKSNRSLEEIARKYKIPEHFQIKAQEDSVKSVLDIGNLRGFKQAYLKFHYRSPRELIEFSNRHFYTPNKRRLYVLNSSYVPYKDTNRVLINHVIMADKSVDTSDKQNLSEVKKIQQLIAEIREQPELADKSIAVLTFFNEQAELLRKEIADPTIKIATVEGIQGDEKDIIIYSFVITTAKQKNKYAPLTGEGGEIRKDIAAGRVNVAFSRARLQVHCVTSLPVKEWPEGIWIKKYLDYVEQEGEVKYMQPELQPFDSDFEKDFYEYLSGAFDQKEYIIYNQFPSCGYKIDFVLMHKESGRKIAIECDGPTHFLDELSEDGIHVDTDIDRQLILESAGWEFYRLPYYYWRNDKDKVIEEIKKLGV